MKHMAVTSEQRLSEFSFPRPESNALHPRTVLAAEHTPHMVCADDVRFHESCRHECEPRLSICSAKRTDTAQLVD